MNKNNIKEQFSPVQCETVCSCSGHDHVHEHHQDHREHGHHHDCGCGCAHDHHHSGQSFLFPVFSFAMLIAGIWMIHAETSWMQSRYQLIWFLVAFIPVGLPVLKDAWRLALKGDIFNEFSLMVIATAGAFFIGEYPEAVAVMLFYTVGELLQHRAVDKATHNIESLLDVRPETANVIRDSRTVQVRPEEVKVGETIIVKPGERVPLDGILSSETASFDTSALTGESVPRDLQNGDTVLAGMISNDTKVKIEVTKPYHESTLARILDLVNDAAERKAPAEQFIRRFARIYTPIVIVLAFLIPAVPAIVSIFVPSFDYVFAEWLYKGLVFLVISCPCALVISVPLGYFAGIGTASRSGILFKGGNYLDAVSHLSSISFDKTGTLTTGKFSVKKVLIDNLQENEFCSIVLSLEQNSTHPIAQAIVEYIIDKGVQALNVEDVREIPGKGLQGRIGGRPVFVGNVRAAEEQGVKVPDELKDSVNTPVVCVIDHRYAGGLVLSDTLKEDAREAIASLKKLNIQDISLLSGDKKEIVEAYAAELHMNRAVGEMLPQDKAEYISQQVALHKGTVAFVGDGMNDAPVLALSDVGIAMGGLGSDAAIESADVVIQNDQPSKVATAILIGRYTNRIVRQNIIGTIGVKVLVLAAALLGFASLWGAVFADVGAALLAVLNALRIMYRKFN